MLIKWQNKNGEIMERKKLVGLNVKEYEHPFDKQALDRLKGTPGLETLTRKIWDKGLDRIFLIQVDGIF